MPLRIANPSLLRPGRLGRTAVLSLFALLTTCPLTAQAPTALRSKALDCSSNSGILCAEVYDSIGYDGAYTGHDEPSLLFYSRVRGSGNSSLYRLRIPKDPPTFPKLDGTGGTFNFQLHPTFWLGMALCGDESAPNPGGSAAAGPNIPCKPNSDSNMFDGSDPTKSNYIGKHPGGAFLELQFYPPPALTGCDLTNWCVAMVIWSLSENMNRPGNGPNGVLGNNDACGGALEYPNFAFIQSDGLPFPPGSPGPFGPPVGINSNTLLMAPGDELVVRIGDTVQGLKVTIDDLTSGKSGFMVASAANGFAQIRFDPNGTNCDPATHNVPYDFHPMYATSSEHTRVPWAAHSYNIAFSDEIGHFEYCNAVDAEGGNCIQASATDPAGADVDDQGCFDPAFFTSLGFVPIGGCFGGDSDFDGVPYQNNWPGTLNSAAQDQLLHAEPVRFTSPLFRDREGEWRNYSRVGFEADLPRIEGTDVSTNNNCQRHVSNPADPNPGQGCVNPPVGASFYPFYTTFGTEEGETCHWQLGGAKVPGTRNTFGGSSATEYGPLLPLAYPAPNGAPTLRYNDFRRVLDNNPCPAHSGD
jgi:hypothetical protein